MSKRNNKYAHKSLFGNPENTHEAYKTLNKEHKLVKNKQDAKQGDLWIDTKNNMLKMNMGNRWLVVNDPTDEKNQKKIKQKFDKIIKKGKERQEQTNRYISPPNFKKWSLFIDEFYKKMQFEKTSKATYNREANQLSDLTQQQKTMLENYSPPIYLQKKLYEDFKLTPIKNPIWKPNLVLPSFFLFLPNNEVITIHSFENGYFINDIKLEWQGNNLWRESKWTHNLISKVTYYKDTEILSEQSSLVLNVLFFLNCVKETTIKELGPIKEIETNEKNIDIIDLKPRVGFLLGEDYKKRVVYKQDKNDDVEILSKKRRVRPHWRKGHWHTVLQGPKRKNRKMRWFRPCFVMGKYQETPLAS